MIVAFKRVVCVFISLKKAKIHLNTSQLLGATGKSGSVHLYRAKPLKHLKFTFLNLDCSSWFLQSYKPWLLILYLLIPTCIFNIAMILLKKY